MEKALAFFGAFNPPTAAHLRLAEHAMRQAGREVTVFVPSQTVYIRDAQGKDYAFPDEARLRMLRAAATVRPWMRVCDWEMRQKRQPRTYETLCHLREEGTQASLLIGSDKLPELENGWRNVREIAEEFGIVCLTRGTDSCARMLAENPFLASLASHIRIVDTPEETRNVSSTAVRRALAGSGGHAEELEKWVTPEVLALLREEMPGNKE